nr:hypothetical protein [Pseudoalteromonas sp. T1lg48]
MQVLKFGGSSLADADCLARVSAIVRAELKEQMLLVLSAPGGMTDALVALSELAKTGRDYSIPWQALCARAEGLKSEITAQAQAPSSWPDFQELKRRLDGVACLASAQMRCTATSLALENASAWP